MAKRMSKDAKKRLKKAVETVENRSAAEIVVSVQSDSGNHAVPGLCLGLVFPLLGLAYMLYADQVFELWAILANTAALEVVGALIGWSLLRINPHLIGSTRVEKRVEEGAMARFYRLGVSRTRDRSGILVHVSSHERRCVVLPDVGVQGAIDKTEWEKAVKPIKDSGRTPLWKGKGYIKLAESIEALAPLLEKALPRRADDVNELADIADEDE